MSKEFGHILFALKVLKTLPHGELSTILKQQRGLYLWGSILPDTTYYFKDIIPFPDPFKLSETIHGYYGENIQKLISPLEKDFQKNPEKTQFLWPLVGGMITHYHLDMALHPIIKQWETLSDDPETTHHLIETWLDKKIFDQFKETPDYKFLKNLRGIPNYTAVKNIAYHAMRFLKKRESNIRINHYIYISCILQRCCLHLFSSPLLKYIANQKYSKKMVPSKYHALFIPSDHDHMPKKLKSVEWNHLKTTWITELDKAALALKRSWHTIFNRDSDHPPIS